MTSTAVSGTLPQPAVIHGRVDFPLPCLLLFDFPLLLTSPSSVGAGSFGSLFIVPLAAQVCQQHQFVVFSQRWIISAGLSSSMTRFLTLLVVSYGSRHLLDECFSSTTVSPPHHELGLQPCLFSFLSLIHLYISWVGYG
ncbi:hypothetical protein VPH35_098593 [Triticum aestivum]